MLRDLGEQETKVHSNHPGSGKSNRSLNEHRLIYHDNAVTDADIYLLYDTHQEKRYLQRGPVRFTVSFSTGL